MARPSPWIKYIDSWLNKVIYCELKPDRCYPGTTVYLKQIATGTSKRWYIEMVNDVTGASAHSVYKRKIRNRRRKVYSLEWALHIGQKVARDHEWLQAVGIDITKGEHEIRRPIHRPAMEI